MPMSPREVFPLTAQYTPRGAQGHSLLAVDISFWASLSHLSQMSALGNVGHGAQDCGGVYSEKENI